MADAIPEYLTVAEVAKALRVTRRTVYAWIASGKLKALQVGTTKRIDAAVLKEAR